MSVVIDGTNGITAPGVETFGNGTAVGGTTNPIVAMTGAANNYVQAYVVNNTNGTSSSADLVAYPSNGNDSHGWVDMGITSLAYADTTYTITGPNESYLFGSGPTGTTGTGNLVFGTDNTGTANDIQFYTGGFTQAKSAAKMVIQNSTGNVGVGTSSPTYRLDLLTPNGTPCRVRWTHNGVDDWSWQVPVGGGFAMLNGNTERLRADGSGNLLVGTTDANQTSGVGLKMIYSATAPSFKTVLNTASGDTAYLLYNTNATNNGYRFYVGANGGVSNFSANNTNLSDKRVKTNIEVCGGYLNKICAIPVKLFNYKDEPENEQRTLGVIAQDVETVAPELVNNDGFGDTPEDGVPLKTIYQTDLQYALMKCIQEQQAILSSQAAVITQLQADVAALKAK
jgi:hypothetical protein